MMHRHHEYPSQIKKKEKQITTYTYNLLTMFCNTNLKVEFKTNNTIKHHVKIKEQLMYIT
jgi:hypothetical protein